MLSDADLMVAYADGDEDAFDALFRACGPLVFGYMRRGGRPVEEARDLTQQAFLHLHRARKDFRRGESLRPWLMTIARNVLRDHLRRERRRAVSVGLEALLDGLAGSQREEPETVLREALDVAIARLPASLRVVVEEHWFAHRPYREIARDLGTSRSAVKVRAHRAYRRLRAILSEEGFGADPAESNRGGPST